MGSLRSLGAERLILVFGCGGDRDRGKRRLMGSAAGRGADLCIVTSDNPRSEAPLAIIGDIEPGLREAGMAPLTQSEASEGRRGYLIDRIAPRPLDARWPGATRGRHSRRGQGARDDAGGRWKRRSFDDRAEQLRRALEEVPA